jgi:peptidoglycan/LPS O-acetylase OafA/YrhL
VVAFHAALPGTAGGFVGVDIFFVISGFLITGMLWREITTSGRIDLLRFYSRRARRLLPSASLVLLVTAVFAARLLTALSARAVIKDVAAAALYGANFRFAAQGTEYLNAGQPPSPVQQYWSLGVEEQFYLLWPVVLITTVGLCVRWRRPKVAALAAIAVIGSGSFALSLQWTMTSPPWAFFSIFTRAWELAVGALLALTLPWLARLPRPVAIALGWAGLMTLLGSCVLLNSATAYPGVAAVYPVAGAAAVIAAGATQTTRGARVLLGRAPFRLIGRLSYSWYLWHWPVLLFAPLLIGQPLDLSARLLAVGVSAVLATLTLIVVEQPVRYAPALRISPQRGLMLAAMLTSATLLCAFVVERALPGTIGHGPKAVTLALGGEVASAQPAARTGNHGRVVAAAPTLAQRIIGQVQADLGRALTLKQVPANLQPTLADAASDKAQPFVDGCLSSWTRPEPPDCSYADTDSPRTVLLMGDSHAAQWLPPLDTIVKQHRMRLQFLGKSACPPLDMPVFSPYLSRNYTECSQWLHDTLAQIRQQKPSLVILGVARHYTDSYHFTVYSQQWLAALALTVREIRAAGSSVVVLGPTPKPLRDEPGCLAGHLDNASICVFARRAALNAAGMAAERAITTAAGGAYLDVSPLICTGQQCPVIVGNILVYRDDNHLTTRYANWLTPALATELTALQPRIFGQRLVP